MMIEILQDPSVPFLRNVTGCAGTYTNLRCPSRQLDPSRVIVADCPQW
jgi:hypothetical protein